MCSTCDEHAVNLQAQCPPLQTLCEESTLADSVMLALNHLQVFFNRMQLVEDCSVSHCL